jgi:hypothetical protein
LRNTQRKGFSFCRQGDQGIFKTCRRPNSFDKEKSPDDSAIIRAQLYVPARRWALLMVS